MRLAIHCLVLGHAIRATPSAHQKGSHYLVGTWDRVAIEPLPTSGVDVIDGRDAAPSETGDNGRVTNGALPTRQCADETKAATPEQRTLRQLRIGFQPLTLKGSSDRKGS
jgi:hypothetical protein